MSDINSSPKSRPQETCLESLDSHKRHTYRESQSHVQQLWGFRDGARERGQNELQSRQDSTLIIAPGPHLAKSENDSKFPSLWAVSPENNAPRAQNLSQPSLWFCQRGKLNFRGSWSQVRSKEEKASQVQPHPITSWPALVVQHPQPMNLNFIGRTSLGVQRVRICLSMQGTWVPSLVREILHAVDN